MSYQVLARKWRPKSFDEIVEQRHVTQALTNALNQGRLHHAYLFTGTRGVGKTTLARIIAKCLNCETGISAKPCGKCSACTEIDQGRFVDLIEVDAASRTKVEDTRELLDNVQYAPTRGRYKIYLIDEVHMLSGHSFNALLKTLEEPPEHVKFLLATTDPQKLPVTVLSRCLQFNLKNIAPEKITPHLINILQQENITGEPAALERIAQAADGSIRDALSLLDQAIAYANGNITTEAVNAMLGTIDSSHLYDLLNALAQHDGSAILTTINQIAAQGADMSIVLEELISLLHHLSICQILPNSIQPSWGDADKLKTVAAKFTPEELQLYYQIGLIGRRDLPLAPTAKSGFEMVLLRMLAFQPTTLSAAAPQPAGVTTPTKPQAATKPQQAASKPVQPATKLDSKLNWSELLTQLALTGPTKALAANCSIKNINEQQLDLLLNSKHAPMLQTKHEERLTNALSQHFGRPIKAVINVVQDQVESPAAITNRQRQQAQQQAENNITNDANVQAIMQEFDATIIPGSITNNNEER